MSCVFFVLSFVFFCFLVGVELSRLRNTENGRRLPGLFVLNKRHQAVESPSHVHRSSVN